MFTDAWLGPLLLALVSATVRCVAATLVSSWVLTSVNHTGLALDRETLLNHMCSNHTGLALTNTVLNHMR